MAVCRRARCIKLTLLSAAIVALLYTLYPEQLSEALAKFSPPHDVQDERRADHQQRASPRVNDPVVIRQRHSDSETYLTPGNPGNFEPMRDEEGEGPGERGAAHRPGAARGEEDQALTEYGMNIVASDQISLDR